MEITKRKHNLDMGIVTLWLHWAVGTGALILPMVLSVWISLTYIPLVVAAEVIGLYYYIQTQAITYPRCYLILNVCARSLVVSTLIMMAICLIYTTGHIDRLYDPQSLNYGIPYICALIISPCTFAISCYNALNRDNVTFCVNCIRRYGSSAERGFIGYVYRREGHMQMVILAWFSGIITLYTWVYYLAFYINVNLNRSDIFFFIVIPAIFYILGLIYTGLRYVGLLTYYAREIVGTARQKGAITELRYIAICGDSMFLAPVDPELPNTRLDTPYSLTLRYRKEVPSDEATDDFCNLAHAKEANVRYLYTSESGNLDGTIRHYVALVNSTDAINEEDFPQGAWYNLYQVKQMVNDSRLTPLLRAEIVRVYTIATAFKTYDREGRRLYKVKRYKPTFKLSQIPDLDVDFNDNRWLFISANNEDRRFFHLRRLYHRLLYARDI